MVALNVHRTWVCVRVRSCVYVCVWLVNAKERNHSIILYIEMMVWWQHMWASCQRVQFYISSLHMYFVAIYENEHKRAYIRKQASIQYNKHICFIIPRHHSCASVVYLWILLFQNAYENAVATLVWRCCEVKQKFPLDLAYRRVAAKFT